MLVRENLCQQEQTVEAEGEARLPHSLHWPFPALHGQLFKSPQAGHKSQLEYSLLLIRCRIRSSVHPSWRKDLVQGYQQHTVAGLEEHCSGHCPFHWQVVSLDTKGG